MLKLAIIAAGLYVVATRTSAGKTLASKLLGKPCCSGCAEKATVH